MDKLIEFKKWFLSRMYGEDSMTNKVYDEISKKITQILKSDEDKGILEDMYSKVKRFEATQKTSSGKSGGKHVNG